jgi:2,3-bisphosphoglycerate-independent phosphoglycerate mutase
MTRRRPVVLVVLDGWGYREEREGNAIALSSTPTWDRLWSRAPRTLLDASGKSVGLPRGQMGNSEVGHLNLGAGRVVMQDLVRINDAIESGRFFENRPFVDACAAVRQSGGTLHLMALIGDGGVHALNEHLFALIDLAERQKVANVAIHALLDGRDTMPTSALGYMKELVARAGTRARVASFGGRYFGMDRDRRWDRTEKWYRAAVEGRGHECSDPFAAIQACYDRKVTDEFIEPHVVTAGGKSGAPFRNGDALICVNYRSDRMRQIVRSLSDESFDGFAVGKRPAIKLVTMTSYDRAFDLPVAFEPQSMANIMAEVVSKSGKTMFRTAETEKYAHVTYFFNGGIEEPFPGEERLLVPSQKVATYDLAPEMSAAGVTDVLCGVIEKTQHDFILCNYANGDMVGHTGSIPATIKAVETVDACLARVVASAEKAGARLLVTADHGNCELMIDPATGGPHTAHTTNPVPLIVHDPDGDRALRSGGALCDVGPTVLEFLGLARPSEMTGSDLRLSTAGAR